MSDNLTITDAVMRPGAGVEYLRQFFRGEKWDVEGLIDILFDDNSESFELDCQEWIVRFATASTDFLRIKNKCLELLELSDFLNLYDKDLSLRQAYQEKLTLAAELTGYFEHAKQLTLIDKEQASVSEQQPLDEPMPKNQDNADAGVGGDVAEAEDDGEGAIVPVPMPRRGAKAFIDDLFSKLKRSGFVYHPRKHINIMMNLFVLNPELMEFSIEELFSIIFTRQIEVWKQYPFRTVMMQALERYIQNTDEMLYAMTGNSSAIDNTMRALVVQLTLGEDKDESFFDRNLSIARLYRYASYKVLGKSQEMFNRAYEFIIGGTQFGIPMYSLYRSKAVDLMASYLNSEMQNSTGCGSAKWQYEANNVCLQIADGKIRFMPTEITNNTKNALPEGLLEWNNVEVHVNDHVGLGDGNIADIWPYKILWRDIEGLLFSEHAKATSSPKHTRQTLEEGDETMITIDSAVDSENNSFVCTILDKNIRGEAYIALSDIVSYLNHAWARNFCDAYGSKLRFMAKVESVDEDGTYHMSMKAGLDEYIKQNVYEGKLLSCTVGGSYVAQYGFQRGICYDGYPMTVKVDKKLENNTRLTAEYVSYDDAYHALQLKFVDLDPDQKKFTPSEAFQRLMAGYSKYCTDREVEVQKLMAEREKTSVPTMPRSHVVELMLIIDRIAFLQENYLASYNYLALARMLARMLNMEEKRKYYNGRMDLIEILNYFAINNEVDEKRFAELESINGGMFTQNVVLRKRFNQVRLVSWLGKPEHNLELRQNWEDPGEDEVISDIAGLALSYNILKQAGLDSQASDVHSQIKNLLNLKGHESALKNYGAMEDVSCEFKTSIVYVPGATNKFDPDTQMDNILKVVDEMLNTRGGIIYLGVNRYGQGVGLKNDLDNVLFHNDKEEYIRFIYKYISNKISPHAANVLVHIDFDKENTEQDICIIKVSQSPVGLPFKGEYCVRRGDSVYRYDKEGYEEYRKIRDSIYGSDEERHLTMLDEGLQAVSVQETTQVESIDEKIGNWDKVQASAFIEHISTSERRLVRTDGAKPLCYLNFLGKGAYKFSDSQTDNIPLSLPIYSDDEYVAVVYSDGTAMYSRVAELSSKNMNSEYRGASTQRITYASAAGSNDSLLLVVNTKAGGVMRVQDFEHLHCGDLLCEGRPVITGETINVEYIDIVDEQIGKEFVDCRNTDCGLESERGQLNMEKLVDLQVSGMV